MSKKYSKQETKLFEAIGPDWVEYANLVEELRFCPVTQIYRQMAEECFIENRQGPEVDALRRCCKALMKGKVDRDTPEWDELINL